MRMRPVLLQVRTMNDFFRATSGALVGWISERDL